MELATAITFLKSLFITKKSYVLASIFLSSSISLGTIMTKAFSNIEFDENATSLLLLLILNLIAGVLILIDLLTGILAARKEGGEIESKKWGLSVGKFLGLSLFSVLGLIVILLISSNYVVMILVFGVIFLAILREYMSIGENIARMYNGKKPYIFSAVDRIFEILEKKIFKILKDSNMS